MNAPTLHSPTILAPYLPTEEVRPRYESSLTLIDLFGRTETGEAYSLRVFLDGRKVRVTWNVQTLEAKCAYQVVRNAYWRKGGWGCSFRSERAALAFAGEKLAVLRGWAAKREAA
jgi:hypothetical protein